MLLCIDTYIGVQMRNSHSGLSGLMFGFRVKGGVRNKVRVRLF